MAIPQVPRAMRPRASGRLFLAVALATFAASMIPELQTFAVPATARASHTVIDVEATSVRPFVSGISQLEMDGEVFHTQRQAAAVPVGGVGAKVMSALGAGAVASVIQAAISAIDEPITNRILVRRMKIMEAIADVKPIQMLKYFKTTLTTNLLKFPFFEAVNAMTQAMPIDPSIRGLVTGFFFTSVTLPVTNFRYRKSMQLEVTLGNLYEAYLPTVIRDMAYGVVRNYATIWLLGLNSAWTTTSPAVMFLVVIIGCLGSAPFNEWRGFSLQSKGQELTFREFFKPQNFIRSTSIGATKQGVALALGYTCAPPATKFIHGLIAAVKGV